MNYAGLKQAQSFPNRATCLTEDLHFSLREIKAGGGRTLGVGVGDTVRPKHSRTIVNKKRPQLVDETIYCQCQFYFKIYIRKCGMLQILIDCQLRSLRILFKTHLHIARDRPLITCVIGNICYLLLINRTRGPYWENIGRGLSGTDRAKRGPYKND